MRRAEKLPRHKGKRLATQPLLSGRNPEVLFDARVRSLADGDQYLDPAAVEKETQARVGGKQIAEKAFFPPKSTKRRCAVPSLASPAQWVCPKLAGTAVFVAVVDWMPHWLERGANPCDHAAYPQIPTCAGCSACPGDTSVCMGNVGLLGADWQDKAPSETGPSAKGKKNLYTSPGRKGGAGTSLVERTIGRNPPVHMKDEYQRGRLLGKQLRKQARERIAKPFNSALSCGSGLFSGRDMFLSSTPGPAHDQAKAERKPAKAFLPANPGKSGAAYCTLSKVGRDYVPLPDDAKVSPLLIPSTYLFVLYSRHLPRRMRWQSTGSAALRTVPRRGAHKGVCDVQARSASQDASAPKPFKPCGGVKDRLSMHTVNPYQYDARPPPDLDFTLFD